MKSPTKIAFLALFILITLISLSRLLNLSNNSPALGTFLDFSNTWSANFEDNHLSSLVKKDLQNKEGNFAVLVEELATPSGQLVSINDQDIFEAGSLYKLFLLAASLEEVEEGNLKLDQKITANISHLKKVFGRVDFGYEDYQDEDKLTYQLDEILQRIATISDNYAAIMLAETIGWDKIQAQADKIGTRSTIIKAPISTSAEDIALFFKKLYLGQIVSKASSDQIIDLLSKSKINDRIPANLPKELKISHKTAELDRLRHDAGIIYLEGRPYIIVLLSQNLKYEDDGVETLAKISQIVFDYLSQKD